MGEGAGAEQVGVGPWPGPWPAGDHWDPDLLRDGDRRNVVDRYRYWRLDAIVADLDTRRHGFHVAVENWGHDFNIGSVIRTANAFNAAAFHIVGQAAVEPARRDGDRPLPARAPPPGPSADLVGAGRPPRAPTAAAYRSSASTTSRLGSAGDPRPAPSSACSSSGRRARVSPRACAPRARSCCTSSSSARRARSTQGPRRPSPCTPGSVGTFSGRLSIRGSLARHHGASTH